MRRRLKTCILVRKMEKNIRIRRVKCGSANGTTPQSSSNTINTTSIVIVFELSVEKLFP